MTHEDFIKIAINLAHENVAAGGQPYGAIAVRRSENQAGGVEIIGRSKNNNGILHAEIAAINNAFENTGQFWMGDCALYSSCEPCDMCRACAEHVGIKKIYYAMDYEDAKLMGHDDIICQESKQPIECELIRNQEIIDLVKNFYDELKKQ